MNLANIAILVFVGIIITGIIILTSIAVRASRRGTAAGGASGSSSGFGIRTPLQIALVVSATLVALNHQTILNWFVAEETVSNLGLWLNPIFWVGAIVAVSTLVTIFNGGTLLKSVTSVIGTHGKKILVPVLALGLVLVLGYFWTDIRDGFTAWFITSDANAQIGLEEETILAWLWLALPAVALLGWLVFGPKKTKGPFQGFSLTGSLWGLLGLAFIVPAVGVILVISLGVGDAISGGKVQNMIDQTFGIEIQREDVDCSLEEFLAANNDIIPFEGGVVTLCPTDGVISFFAAERAEVEVRFQRDFASRNQEVLQTRFPSSFYVVQRGGGLRDSHELFVIETGFISSGLSSIDVFIRSVRP